jgi:hypothetical protein
MTVRSVRRSIAVVTLALGACASAPPERFWQLPMPPVLPAHATAQGLRSGVAVGPVGLPEVFDRPQLVTGVGTELRLWESQRWSEPLRLNLGRALAARLANELTPMPVIAWPLVAGEPAVRVSLNVLRFDAELGRGVDDELQWSIRRLADGLQRSGRSAMRQPAAGAGHEDLVAAHGAVLDAVSRDIARAIRELPPPAPVSTAR